MIKGPLPSFKTMIEESLPFLIRKDFLPTCSQESEPRLGIQESEPRLGMLTKIWRLFKRRQRRCMC